MPLLAQIVGLVDVFDALTTERPHKKPYPLAVALSVIEGLAGPDSLRPDGTGGLFYYFYQGIHLEIFPPIIFLGVGALTDFVMAEIGGVQSTGPSVEPPLEADDEAPAEALPQTPAPVEPASDAG